MRVEESPIKDLFVINPNVIEDHRGYFYESFNQKSLDDAIAYSPIFVQDNQSQSKYGVLRGLHLQMGEHAQAKLIRAITGTILDVAIDVRLDSENYGKYFIVELSADNKKQLFVPRGFAHGFVVLSERATIHYKADNYYNKESESGLFYNDPALNIDWGVPVDRIITSEKDLLLPTLAKFKEVLEVSTRYGPLCR
jgi:dTDP-4-dehydrorhamnose 3,5-epimerase